MTGVQTCALPIWIGPGIAVEMPAGHWSGKPGAGPWSSRPPKTKLLLPEEHLDEDPFEPLRVAKSIKLMGLKHAVITSVDRDDLKDGGSTIWAKTIEVVRKMNPGITIETLIPDFQGKWENLSRIVEARPEIVSHNLETVRRLTKLVRVQAKYDRSLEVLKRLGDAGVTTKSGIMLGLGESTDEIMETLDDMRTVGVQIVTLGQYLQPTPNHLPVQEFVKPEQFEWLGEQARQKGFSYVESGPLVRSSYHAEKHI